MILYPFNQTDQLPDRHACCLLSQLPELGVRRPAVTVAVGILERAGLIAHQRGRIRITDRQGLEAAACECYALIRERQQELQGP